MEGWWLITGVWWARKIRAATTLCTWNPAASGAIRARVGDWGSHNALFVDGGSVFVTNYMAVGYNPLYDNNFVELDSGQIIVTNQTHDAVLEVYGGGFLLAGGTLWVDTLVVTNDGAQFMHIGGTLIYRNLQLTRTLTRMATAFPTAGNKPMASIP